MVDCAAGQWTAWRREVRSQLRFGAGAGAEGREECDLLEESWLAALRFGRQSAGGERSTTFTTAIPYF